MSEKIPSIRVAPKPPAKRVSRNPKLIKLAAKPEEVILGGKALLIELADLLKLPKCVLAPLYVGYPVITKPSSFENAEYVLSKMKKPELDQSSGNSHLIITRKHPGVYVLVALSRDGSLEITDMQGDDYPVSQNHRDGFKPEAYKMHPVFKAQFDKNALQIIDLHELDGVNIGRIGWSFGERRKVIEYLLKDGQLVVQAVFIHGVFGYMDCVDHTAFFRRLADWKESVVCHLDSAITEWACDLSRNKGKDGFFRLTKSFVMNEDDWINARMQRDIRDFEEQPEPKRVRFDEVVENIYKPIPNAEEIVDKETGKVMMKRQRAVVFQVV